MDNTKNEITDPKKIWDEEMKEHASFYVDGYKEHLKTLNSTIVALASAILPIIVTIFGRFGDTLPKLTKVYLMQASTFAMITIILFFITYAGYVYLSFQLANIIGNLRNNWSEELNSEREDKEFKFKIMFFINLCMNISFLYLLILIYRAIQSF